MRLAMAGEKQHFAPGVTAPQDIGGGRPVRGIQRQRFVNRQPFQLGQAGAADNGVDSHRQILSRATVQLSGPPQR